MSCHNKLDVLPDELLMDVVELALKDSKSYRDVLNLSSLNRRTRAITLSCPSIWANIRFNHTQASLNLARLAFLRSKCSNLTFEIDLNEQASSEALSDIQDFLHASSTNVVQGLSARIGRLPVDLNMTILEASLELLNCSQLEDLLIHWEALEGVEVFDVVGLPDLPKLKHFKFGGFLPQPRHGTLSSLKRLSFLDQEHITKPEAFFVLLNVFPNVQHIDFKGLWFDVEVEPFTRSISVETLERVTFTDTLDVMVCHFFQHVETPRLHTVTLANLITEWFEVRHAWHPITTTTPHTSVQNLELRPITRSPLDVGDIAPYLPVLFPDLHTITIDFGLCVCWREVAEFAEGGGFPPMWIHLQTIVITGIPDDSEKEYRQAVQWLADFASARNKSSSSSTALLSITFEVAFPWEGLEMDALSLEVDQIQVGGMVIKGAISIPDADADADVTNLGD